MNARLLFVPFFLFVASAVAADPPKVDSPKVEKADPKAEDDPIAAQLLKDKEAYVAAQDKARTDLLKAFDKHYETVKGNKAIKIELQLVQLEKIEAEKKAFEENGVLPTLTGMKVGLSEYRSSLKKAETQCKAAFEAAAKAYRDKGDVKAAGAMLEEMKEFLAKTPTASVASGTFVIGSKLSGKVLGLNGVGDGAKVVTADYVKGDETQLWKWAAAGNGWFYLENVKTGLVLTVKGKENSTDAIITKKQANDDGQLWVSAAVANQPGFVKIGNKASNKVIGINAKSKEAGARVILWTDENDSSQWYGLVPPK
jgi:hypothetical protein